MGLIKKLSNILLIVMLSISTFAIKVVQSDTPVNEAVNNPATQNEGLKSAVIMVLTFGFIGILFCLAIFIFAWLLLKVWKKLTAYKREKNFMFEVFTDNVNQAHINHDTKLKKKNWLFLWIFWKRKPVFIENSKGKLEVIGQYHGETLKKEGFYMLAVTNKISMFQTIEQIIIIPLSIKDKIIKKIDVDKGRTMIIRCEGLDTIENTDFYLIPLIKDENTKRDFLDFSNLVHKNFIEVTTYVDIINKNLMSHRKNVVQSVETNPFIHFGRRGDDNFKK